MKNVFYNTHHIAKVEIFPAKKCGEHQFEYSKSFKNFFGEFFDEAIIEKLWPSEERRISFEKFREKYGYKFFLVDKIPHQKAHIIVTFSSGTHDKIFFDHYVDVTKMAEKLTQNVKSFISL